MVIELVFVVFSFLLFSTVFLFVDSNTFRWLAFTYNLYHTSRSRSLGRMDGQMDNMNWNMYRNMDGMERLNRMDRMDRMDMNWMEGRRNERQMRSRSNSVRRTRSTRFDYWIDHYFWYFWSFVIVIHLNSSLPLFIYLLSFKLYSMGQGFCGLSGFMIQAKFYIKVFDIFLQ